MKNLYTVRYWWFEGTELREWTTVVDADNPDAALSQLHDARYHIVKAEIVHETKAEALYVA